MKITPTGRVTIPKAVMDAAGLLPGTEVEFITDGDGVLIVPSPAPMDGARLIDHLQRHSAMVNMSTEEIMALTRDDYRDLPPNG